MQKIMFNDKYGLTDAVLQGRKTMTRRVCKDKATNEVILSANVDSWLFYPDDNLVEFLMKDGNVKVSVLPYKIGEVVAVAQSYKDLKLSYIPHIDEPDFKTCTKHAPQWGNPRGMKGWFNKMFVRADVMPHQIRITDIKVERLQDISDEDCLKEGIITGKATSMFTFLKAGLQWWSIRLAFSALIDAVSRKGTWNNNPYVFAHTFELVK